MLSYEGMVRLNHILSGFYRLIWLNLLWIATCVLGLGLLGVGPATYALAKYVDWMRTLRSALGAAPLPPLVGIALPIAAVGPIVHALDRNDTPAATPCPDQPECGNCTWRREPQYE